MRKKRRHRRKKEDLRVVKKTWNHKILTLTGFALLLFFISNLSIEGIISEFPTSNEIALALISVLTISFIVERSLKLKKGRIYENFYSVYLGAIILVLTILYWITFLNGIDIGPFRTLIVLTHIIIFLYSLITIEHSQKVWFIVVSYAFVALITIILFAFIYWTLAVFGVGHLQFNNCSSINPEAESENYFYFSSVTFYALGYGDICPVAHWTRLISQIEVALGALINTILIGFIFWKIRETDIEEEVEKRKK